MGKISYEKMSTFRLYPNNLKSDTSLSFEVKHINYDYSLRFSLWITGDEYNHGHTREFKSVEEPLTVAYF